MRQWSNSIDPASIPDAVLTSERARRNAAKRRTFGAGSGRPKVMRSCPNCGVEFSTSDLRRHHCKTTSNPVADRITSTTLKSE